MQRRTVAPLSSRLRRRRHGGTMDQREAAILIQALLRGKWARRLTEKRRTAPPDRSEEKDEQVPQDMLT